MNARILICLILSAVSAFSQDPKFLAENPALKPILDQMQREARANFEAACMDVTREVAEKRVKIYAVARPNLTKVKQDGFEIEVLYHPELAKEHVEVSGAYHNHHNHLVLTFAAAQFAAGKKELGLRLVRLLAQVQPEMWWSSPDHPPITLKKILAGLEQDNESVRQFLKEESDDWKYREKTYGPQSDTSSKTEAK